MAPSRNWRSRVDGSAWCEGASGLKILPAGMQALVGHDHVGAGQRQRARRRQAGRSRAHHQHVAGDLLARARRARRAAASATGAERTSMPACDLGEAGALVGPAVDRDQAVEADAHAAERPARRARTGLAHGDDVGGRQRRGDGLARQRLDLATVEAKADRWAGRPHVGVLQAHGKRFTMPRQRRPMSGGSSDEEVSRHLYRPDHALHRRRQEGRRSGAKTPGRFPDRGRHPRPDPARQHRRVPERDAGRAAADRRDRGQAGGRPRAGADRHRRGMDRRGRAHQPRGRVDGRRRRDDHPALLQRADRRRALRPLQESVGRDLDPDHGLQQPGDGQRRHDAGADRAASPRSRTASTSRNRRSIRRACATSFAWPATG